MPPVVGSARWGRCAAREGIGACRPSLFPSIGSWSIGAGGHGRAPLSEKYNPRHEDTANYIVLRAGFFGDVAGR